jgi:hypothetical protein
VAHAEIHGRRHTELEVAVQTQFAQHAHHEAIVPAVLVAPDHARGLAAILILNNLWANVLQLQILQVGTYEQTEMEGAQVGVGAVLHRPAHLCAERLNARKHQYDQKNRLSHFTL